MKALHNPEAGCSPLFRLGVAGAAIAARRNVRARLRLGLALWLFGGVGALATGCAAPTAGLWSGTADLGTLEARPIVLSLPVEQPDQALSGVVELRLADGPQRFTICRGRARNHRIELEIDWTHRDCQAPAGQGQDRRILRGSYGPGLIAGVIVRLVAAGKEEQVGFFRAYRADAG